ncbi:MAG: hypothetical protein JWM95_4273 [Gemmatimonadetes bacterium]|nr:hypothetical protein [Gemmatimonadota bacterium]
MIEVVFRGPILFVYRGTAVLRALIPDASRPLAGGRHADRSEAKLHTAEIGVMDHNRTELPRTTLRHMRVNVVDESAAPGRACEKDISFDALVPLHRLVNQQGQPRTVKLRQDAAPDFWSHAATTITFTGGMMSTRNESPLTFEVPTTLNTEAVPPRRLPLLSVWRPNSGAGVRIEITRAEGDGEQRVMHMSDGQTAFICNWDDPSHSLARIAEIHAPLKAGPVDDNDFKWLYQLLVPPVEDWAQAIGRGRKLPAPQADCPKELVRPAAASTGPVMRGMRTIDTSTCFGGSWCCGPDTDPDECK